MWTERQTGGRNKRACVADVIGEAEWVGAGMKY